MSTQQALGEAGRLDELGSSLPTEDAGAGGESAGREAPAGSAAEGGEGRDYEAEAKEMGWVPQDQFHDSPDKWVDAQDFVERGEHILPILRANNKKFRKELSEKEAKLNELTRSLEEQGKVMKTLQKHYKDSVDAQVKAAKEQLIAELKEARQMGDVDKEVEIEEKLAEVRNGPVQSSNPEPLTKEEKSTLDPATVEWMKENPWFGNMEDKDSRVKTRSIMRIAEDFREAGDTSTGKTFMNKCLAELDFRNNRTGGKVEGGSRGTPRQIGGRAYDRLSKEAKDACMEDKDMFVGPGKMFKEVREWQDHFASIYDKE